MERFFHESGFEIAISPVSDVTGLVILRQKISGLMQTPPFFGPSVLEYLLSYARVIKVLFAENETWRGFFDIVVLMKCVHQNKGD